MTLTLRIIAGIFAAIATILFKYEHNLLGTFSILLTIVFLGAALFANNNESKTKNHTEKQRALFTTASEIAKARTRITLDLTNEFKTIFEENKYFIKPAQEKMLIGLVSDLGDIRIDDEELKSDTLAPGERKALVAHRRKLLDRVENMQTTIENYSRKIT
ncbi:MAG: hypothetical protein WC256_12300 [Desulfurivibrionaceae bacterium]|jgi:hypothetical protein